MVLIKFSKETGFSVSFVFRECLSLSGKKENVL